MAEYCKIFVIQLWRIQNASKVVSHCSAYRVFRHKGFKLSWSLFHHSELCPWSLTAASFTEVGEKVALLVFITFDGKRLEKGE